MASNAVSTPSTFEEWSTQQVKEWIQRWNTEFGVSQSTINNVLPKMDMYQINGMALLYLGKNDLLSFQISDADANIVMTRIQHLHKNPTGSSKNDASSKSTPKKPQMQEENKESNQNDSNSKYLSTTTFTEGYLSTKRGEVYICLQKGNYYTKMAIDAACTVYQLKQKYLSKSKEEQKSNDSNDNKDNIDDIVLLFMGKVLEDKKTLMDYKIGYTNVTTIFVAHRIRSKASAKAKGSTKGGPADGEAAGVLFVNKNDNSEHILYVDVNMTILELKKVYKSYLIKEFESKQRKKEAQMLYEQSLSFECSGQKFPDKSILKDCGIGMTELQYIFVSFGTMKEEEKETDDDYISKIYKMTPKEHKEVTSIKQSFEKSIKSTAFQKSVKEITPKFKAVSKAKLDQIKSYPQIQDIAKELTNDHSKKAKEYTKKILNTPPTGKLGQDTNTTLHVLSNIFKSTGEECVFFDSRQGHKLVAGDSGCAIHEAFEKNKPFTLRLKNMQGLYGVTDDDMKDDTKKLIEMQSAINNNVEHPTLTHVRNKLSAALGVKKERIRITEVFSGSDCFKYTVDNLTFLEKQRMIQGDPTRRLAQQFQQFKELKIHPLLFRPAFDVANFDKKGDKSFVSLSSKFQVGPANMKKEYTQPTGWTRYGLKVLGKYNDDKWLHPFNDAGNWWRAFHGTKNAVNYGVNAADAMHNIHQNGFDMAHNIALGPGVYCSPKPTFVERSYAAQVTMNIQDNNNGNVQVQQKNFKFMLQVAVKPGANTLQPRSNDSVWAVRNKDDIRAYGILIKEV